jgi:hypothetical protein
LSPLQFEALCRDYAQQQEIETRRTASILCMLANINRDTKKHPKGFTVDDFMPETEDKPKADWRAQLAAMKAAFGK